MLPLPHRLAFLLFAAITLALGAQAFLRLYRRIRRGRPDTDSRLDHLPARIAYALLTTLTQSRTFRKRPWVSFFHSFIFYGFTFYLLVNLLDAIDGFHELPLTRLGLVGNLYTLAADILSFLVLLGVLALVARRFLLPARRDFTFNPRTLLHPALKRRAVTLDSVIVSTFILFHVGSRAIGAGAKLAIEGPDPYAPFATALSHLVTPANALAWRIFGYWGALGSVPRLPRLLPPLQAHPTSSSLPAKYLVHRPVNSGVLPAVDLNLEADPPQLAPKNLEDLAWPRLLDAYACIQCNRCQDVCPATATGKSLSPSALEINKRMELNALASTLPAFETGAPSPSPLLAFALSPEAAWACTTCGACIDVCPVGDEPMLDIVDIRRQQVMIEGEFPPQLQTAFRGMERAQNPWGINHDKRPDWAAGLNVKTTDQEPHPRRPLLGRLRRLLRPPVPEDRPRLRPAPRPRRRRLRRPRQARVLHRRHRPPRRQRVPIPPARRHQRRHPQRGPPQAHRRHLPPLHEHRRQRIQAARRRLQSNPPHRVPRAASRRRQTRSRHRPHHHRLPRPPAISAATTASTTPPATSSTSSRTPSSNSPATAKTPSAAEPEEPSSGKKKKKATSESPTTASAKPPKPSPTPTPTSTKSRRGLPLLQVPCSTPPPPKAEAP